MIKFTFFEKFIEKNLKKGKPKIAFGLNAPDGEVLKSLKRIKKYSEIILIGPRKIAKIKEFKKIISEEPEKKLAEILIKIEVEGIIRGTVDAFKTFEAYQSPKGRGSC